MRPTYAQCWFTIFYFLLHVCSPLPAAAATNRTIDDEYGDEVTGQKLVYSPAQGWTQGSKCTDCLYHPTTAYNGTWHDATQHPDDPDVRTITVNFTGTAVYVYNFLASYYIDTKNLTVTYMTFEIDGARVGEFFRDQIFEIDLNASRPIYVNEALTNKQHTMVIRVPPGPNGKAWSFVLFDRIVYTMQDDNSTSASTTFTTSSPSPTSSNDTSSGVASSHSPIGAIVGGVVGGVVVLVTLAILLWFLRRRSRSRATSHQPRFDAEPALLDDPDPGAATPPAQGVDESTHNAGRPSQLLSSTQPNTTPMRQTDYAPAILPFRPARSERSMTVTSSGDTKTPVVLSPPMDHSVAAWEGTDPQINAQLSAIEMHAQRIRELERRLEAVEVPPGYDETDGRAP